MASGAVKVALMAFFVIIICAILLVPIAIMVTLEEKEEMKSTVAVAEKLLKKTAKTDPTEVNTPIEVTATPEPTTTTIATTTTESNVCSNAFVNQKSSPPIWGGGDLGGCNQNYVGDGYCDGACNTPENEFDGGDCCSNTITFQYCKVDDCECYCYTEGKQYEAYEGPPMIGGGGGNPMIPGGGGGGLPPIMPPLLGGGGAGLPPPSVLTTTDLAIPTSTDSTGSGLQCSNAFVGQKMSPPICGEPGNPCISGGGCNLAYVGDGYCDGLCNTPEHEFDGGDCCSSTITFDYCDYDTCQCYCYTEGKQYEAYEGPPMIGGGGGNPLTPPGGGGGGLPPILPPVMPPAPPPTPTTGQCQPDASCSISAKLSMMPGPDLAIDPIPSSSACNVAYIGDGYCDGGCNVPNPDNDPTTTADDYDGGDCCSPNQSYNFCNFDCCECFCHQEGIQYEEPGFGTPPPGPVDLLPVDPNTGSTCISSYIGDGFCDADCNNGENGFDDGDCCLDVIQDQYCNAVEGGCICHEDGMVHPAESIPLLGGGGGGLPPMLPPMILGK